MSEYDLARLLLLIGYDGECSAGKLAWVSRLKNARPVLEFLVGGAIGESTCGRLYFVGCCCPARVLCVGQALTFLSFSLPRSKECASQVRVGGI
jgi:hypothetical protein